MSILPLFEKYTGIKQTLGNAGEIRWLLIGLTILNHRLYTDSKVIER